MLRIDIPLLHQRVICLSGPNLTTNHQIMTASLSAALGYAAASIHFKVNDYLLIILIIMYSLLAKHRGHYLSFNFVPNFGNAAY
jgi:hypothetical protein